MSDRRKTRSCLVMGFVIFVAGATVLTMSGKHLQRAWSFGKEMFALRSAIQEEFELDDVGVHWQVNSNVSSLVLKLDADEFRDLSEEEIKKRAKQIAQFAMQRLKTTENLEHVKVMLSRQAGVIFAQEEYRFVPAELMHP